MENKLKHIVLILSSTFILFQIYACRTENKTNTSTSTTTYFVAGKIVDMTGLDGCRFMVEIDSVLYEPSGLKEEFQVDNLKVYLKYEIEMRSSICMAGKGIKIIDCKKRE